MTQLRGRGRRPSAARMIDLFQGRSGIAGGSGHITYLLAPRIESE